MLIRRIITSHFCTAVGGQQFRKESSKLQMRIKFECYYFCFHFWLLSCRYVMLQKRVLNKPKWGARSNRALIIFSNRRAFLFGYNSRPTNSLQFYAQNSNGETFFGPPFTDAASLSLPSPSVSCYCITVRTFLILTSLASVTDTQSQ